MWDTEEQEEELLLLLMDDSADREEAERALLEEEEEERERQEYLRELEEQEEEEYQERVRESEEQASREDEGISLHALIAQENARCADLDDDEEPNEFERTYTVNGREGCQLLGYADGGGRVFEDPDGNVIVPEGSNVTDVN